ncbi:MAG: ATP-binding protein [Deltaproteobacteria bacterium]|nr:ATP-binding protein [Deltaproteobacteria bacterium]
MAPPPFRNPYRPGAGHPPPHLAGRKKERTEFQRLLTQETILENMVLTGLRGVGKTVLLDSFRPEAIHAGWLWVGADLSESTSVSEETLAIRLLTDLAPVTSTVPVGTAEMRRIGFETEAVRQTRVLDYATLLGVYNGTPGLVADKLKTVLTLVWSLIATQNRRGLVFAYDEAQNLSDQSDRDQYPLSLLLDVFQSIQKQGIPMMLFLTGLPTLFPKLVEARTFSERMFRVVFLDRLSDSESRDAILKPLSATACPVRLDERSVALVIEYSGGYPYFLQFICKEVFDIFLQKADVGERLTVPIGDITRKLDTDFFAGRWARATDRQREMLTIIARMLGSQGEFSVQEVVEQSSQLLDKPFSSSHANQMLGSLCRAGLVYKNRRGRYSFAVPLLDQFILRQVGENPPRLQGKDADGEG